MDINYKSESHAESLLLSRFNNRDCDAFSELYLSYYDDLFFFAARLFRDTEVVAGDVIQDVFVNLWEANRKFTGLINIKAYLLISIKNSFRNYLKHKKCTDKHLKAMRLEDDYFITQLAEIEIVSFAKESLKLLPEVCAEVFKCYLEGLDVKETAQRLGKTTSTVYAQKREAIEILKSKFPKDRLIFILFLFG